MTPRPVDETSDTPQPQHRLRFELIFGSAWLAFGLFALPALVYWVGIAVLGPYGEGVGGDGAGVGDFYGNFFADLASGSGRAWTLAAGPVVLISILRLVLLRRPTPAQPGRENDYVGGDTAPRHPRPAASSASRPSNRRVEPRVTLD